MKDQKLGSDLGINWGRRSWRQIEIACDGG
jgi:hypothetical protein